MPIPDADPRAKELDSQFAAAMSGPQKPRSEPKTPKEIDPEAPFGRDDDGKPLAPHGYRNDGQIRRAAGGRQSKKSADQARVTDSPAASQKPVEGKVVADDYTRDIAEAADGIWLAMTAGSRLPLGRLRIGKFGLPPDAQDRVAAQAFLLSENKLKLAAALNVAAQHNARARALAQKCRGGDLSWVLTVGSLALPFLFQSAAVWKGSDRLAELEMPSAGELAKRNDERMGSYMDAVISLSAEMAAEQEAQAADAVYA